MESNTITAAKPDRNALAYKALWQAVKEAAERFGFSEHTDYADGSVEPETTGTMARVTTRTDVIISLVSSSQNKARTLRIQRGSKRLISSTLFNVIDLHTSGYTPETLAACQYDADFFQKLFLSLFYELYPNTRP